MRAAGLAVLAVLLLAACGERGSVARAERGYQGKPDGKPWDNAPLAWDHPKWDQGDRASWEAQIQKRQLGQHEYKRIYD